MSQDSKPLTTPSWCQVDRDEFIAAMRQLGLSADFQVSEAALDGLFTSFDTDGSGALEFHELRRLPTTTIDYVRRGIDNSMRGTTFSDWQSWSGAGCRGFGLRFRVSGLGSGAFSDWHSWYGVLLLRAISHTLSLRISTRWP